LRRLRRKQRIISGRVPGVKGCDVGSRRKKRFAAASSGGPGTDVVSVAVADLRCTAAAAIQLRDAIDKAPLIGMRHSDRIAQAVRAYFPIGAEN